jgi:hypothetical protein
MVVFEGVSLHQKALTNCQVPAFRGRGAHLLAPIQPSPWYHPGTKLLIFQKRLAIIVLDVCLRCAFENAGFFVAF